MERKYKVVVCERCGFEIKCQFEKHFKSCDGRGPRRKRKKQGFGWSKGLTKDSDKRLKKLSDKLKERSKSGKWVISGYKHNEEMRKILSDKMKKRYESGWESTAGRCRKIDYESPVAGKIKVDGNWELRVAKYLDDIGVRWIRNKKRFKYFNHLKNKESTYCPDFYVFDWGCYLEVKGYKTELDDIKWQQFLEKLEIWDRKKLNSLGIETRYKKT